jgi:hypothetical protein
MLFFFAVKTIRTFVLNSGLCNRMADSANRTGSPHVDSRPWTRIWFLPLSPTERKIDSAFSEA